MTDLARSDSVWLEGFWRKFGLGLRLGRTLLELRDRFSEERIQIQNVMDKNGNVHADDGSITIAGAKLGANTTEDGKVFVRVTGSGPYTVTLYKATGGASGNKVAEGSAAAGAVATLAEQNSSGMTGTLKLAGSVTAEADDAHFLRIYPDWRLEGRKIFDGANDIPGDDSKALDAWNAALDDMADSVDDMLSRLDGYFSEFMVSAANNARGYGAEFLKSAETALLSESSRDGGSGEITRLRTGVLFDLFLAMEDNTSGSTQTVVRRLLAGAAAVPDANNSGQATVASHVPEDHAEVGTYYLTCVAGVGSGDGGEEQFRVSFVSSEDDTTRTHSELLTIGQPYTGERGFGPITMVRTLTKTGDPSHNNLSNPASGWTVTGPTEDNTSAGVLYWKITANGSNWTVGFYKSITLAESDKVSEVLSAATSSSFVASPKNGSGLTISGSVGSSPSTSTSGILTLNFHHVENAAKKPDRYTLEVTQTSTGLAQRLMAKLLDFKLKSAAAGAEVVPDTLLAEANTWEPFATLDN